LVGGTVLAVSLLVVGVAAGADGSTEESEWAEVIEEARTQMRARAFEGVVVVEWQDVDGPHRTEVQVRQHDGRVEVVGVDRKAEGDASSVMLDGQAWTSLGGSAGAATVELTRGKYRINRSRGPTIAGYPTTRYEATRDGRAVERVYVGRDAGFVLRREVFDEEGEVVRAVSFTVVHDRTDGSTTASGAEPARGPRRVEDLDAPFRDPAAAGNGFRLLGRWQHSDELAQLYYSDGVVSVSVFEQPGRLDWSAMPRGGVDSELDGRHARRYALPVGEAWVFERGGVVYTCVGDASEAELVRLASDVSRPDESRIERMAEMVVEPFRW
jgi:sigma-E factor negative regulatory protein RseB